MLDTLKTILTGAVRIWQEEEFFCFSRFTRDQAEILRRRGFHPREESSAGMRLEFTTRGGEIAFEYMALPGSGRGYYGLEVTVDGLGVYHADYDTLPHAGSLHYAVLESEMPRRVCVYFPNLAQLRIRNLILPTDAEACPRKRNYLALGDSITQGYDALHPNQSYANLLADALDAHVLNQAIGGDVFCPENLDPALPFQPDLITVAYGTNDWGTCALREDTVRAYLDKLTGLYPGVFHGDQRHRETLLRQLDAISAAVIRNILRSCSMPSPSPRPPQKPAPLWGREVPRGIRRRRR